MARRRWCRYGVLAFCLAAGTYVLLTGLEKNIDRRDIRLAQVDSGELETTVTASGRVVPAYEEIINSPVTTRVEAVYVQSGDSVRAGTPLLQLDLSAEQTGYEKMLDRLRMSRQELSQLQLASQTQLSELAMQISVKEMQVNRMEIDVVNERRLDSLGSGTGERVRMAETACATAVLELRQLRERLSNERLRCRAAEEVQQLGVSSIEKDIALMETTLRRGQIPAPHDGVLTYVVTEIGSQVAAGEKVAVVSNLSKFKILGEVAEGSSDRVGIGSRVEARIGGAVLSGIVSNITPQAKGGVVSFVVSLDDPGNSRLRSGLRSELSVTYGYKDDVVRMPSGAYFKGPGEYRMFVLEGTDRLVRRTVRVGDSNRDYVEVLSGLSPGDKVVISDMDIYKNKKSLKIKD